jgi:hypothetical protein
VRRSTIAVVGVVALLGGTIAMVTTNATDSIIGIFAVGSVLLMTLFM